MTITDVAPLLVQAHLLRAGEEIRSVRERGAEAVVQTDGLGWRVREPSRVEFLLEASEYDIYEATLHIFVVGGMPRAHGFAVFEGGESVYLNREGGFATFAIETRPSPLSLALLLVRHRAPELLGEWPVELLTRGNLDLRLADLDLPVPFSVEDDLVAFTTQFRSPDEHGRLALGIHRWVVQMRPDDSLVVTIDELHRTVVDSAP